MNKKEEVALRKAKFQQMLDEIIAEAQERDPSEIWEISPFSLKEPLQIEQDFSDTHKVKCDRT
jgi:hypothetical protein